MHFAIDTETTSLKDPFPVEIAAVKVDDFSVAFCERIRATEPIDPYAEAVHGISDRSLINCRPESEVMTDFLKFIVDEAKGSHIVLVAHNAKFDQTVIQNALQRCNLALPPSTTWECTMQMSRAKKFKNCKLSDCCLRAGIDYKDAHSALPDAIMCARVFKDFFKCDDYWNLLDEGLSQVNEEERLEMEERSDVIRTMKNDEFDYSNHYRYDRS
jgi:DNA polymerase III epsilon subunit-like protein